MTKPHDIAYGPTARDYTWTPRSHAGAERIRQVYKDNWGRTERDHELHIQDMQRHNWLRLRENEVESKFDKWLYKVLSKFNGRL
jgi:hypothetical protein